MPRLAKPQRGRMKYSRSKDEYGRTLFNSWKSTLKKQWIQWKAIMRYRELHQFSHIKTEVHKSVTVQE